MERHLTVFGRAPTTAHRPTAPARPLVDAQFEAVPTLDRPRAVAETVGPIEVALVERRQTQAADARAPRAVLQLIDDGIIVV